jgi:hypothetical protein
MRNHPTTVAAAGRGRCHHTACSPYSTLTRSIPESGPFIQNPGEPSTTARVGSATSDFS